MFIAQRDRTAVIDDAANDILLAIVRKLHQDQ